MSDLNTIGEILSDVPENQQYIAGPNINITDHEISGRNWQTEIDEVESIKQNKLSDEEIEAIHLVSAISANKGSSWKTTSEKLGSEGEGVYIGSLNTAGNEKAYVIGDSNTTDTNSVVLGVENNITNSTDKDIDVISIGKNNEIAVENIVNENEIVNENISIGRNNDIKYDNHNGAEEQLSLNIGTKNITTNEGINIGKNNSANNFGLTIGQNVSSNCSKVIGESAAANNGSYLIGKTSKAEFGSYVIGESVTANGGSYIFGKYNSKAEGGSFIIGSTDSASNGSIVVGSASTATNGSYIVGEQNSANNGSEIMGNQNIADYGSNIIGDRNSATNGSVSIGHTVTSDCASISLGFDGILSNTGSIAGGGYGINSKNQSVAFGNNGVTASGKSVSLGTHGVQSYHGSISLGREGISASTASVSIGIQNVYSENAGVAVGIKGVGSTKGSFAAGRGDLSTSTLLATDGSVAVGNGKLTAANGSFAIGNSQGGNVISDKGSLLLVNTFGSNVSSLNGSIGIGGNNFASKDGSIVIGYNNITGDKGSISIGNGNVSSNNGSLMFAIWNASADHLSTVIGSNRLYASDDSIVIGNHSYDNIYNQYGQIIGQDRTKSAVALNDSISIGRNTVGAASTAIGTNNSAFGWSNVIGHNNIIKQNFIFSDLKLEGEYAYYTLMLPSLIDEHNEYYCVSANTSDYSLELYHYNIKTKIPEQVLFNDDGSKLDFIQYLDGDTEETTTKCYFCLIDSTKHIEKGSMTDAEYRAALMALPKILETSLSNEAFDEETQTITIPKDIEYIFTLNDETKKLKLYGNFNLTDLTALKNLSEIPDISQSFVFGNNNILNSNNNFNNYDDYNNVCSVVMGSNNVAGHYNSFIFGTNNTTVKPIQTYQTDLINEAEDDDGYTFAFGKSNTATRNYDIAMGLSSFASGGENIVIGTPQTSQITLSFNVPGLTTLSFTKPVSNSVALGYKNLVYNSLMSAAPGVFNNITKNSMLANATPVDVTYSGPEYGSISYNDITNNSQVYSVKQFNYNTVDKNSVFAGNESYSYNILTQKSLMYMNNDADYNILAGNSELISETPAWYNILFKSVLSSDFDAGSTNFNVGLFSNDSNVRANILYNTYAFNSVNCISYSDGSYNDGYISEPVDGITSVTFNNIREATNNFGINNASFSTPQLPVLKSSKEIVNHGDNTVVSSERSILFGTQNLFNYDSNCYLFGHNNDIVSANYGIILGEGSYINNNRYSLAFGCRNVLESGGMYNTVIGERNYLNYNGSNSYYDTLFNVLYGKLNFLQASTTSQNNIIFGNENSAINSTFTNIIGEKNYVAVLDKCSTLIGSNNSAFNSSNTSDKRYGYDLVVGKHNLVSGDLSIALGGGNSATNHLSVAIGQQNVTTGEHQVVIGKYNSPIPGVSRFNKIGSTEIDTTTGALFVIGNGYSTSSDASYNWQSETTIHRSNAMIVSADGTVSAAKFTTPDGDLYNLISTMSATITALEARVAALEGTTTNDTPLEGND